VIEMRKTKKISINKVYSIVLVLIGLSLTALSIYFVSSFLAVFGGAAAFWGLLFLYVTPSRHVPLTLLNASADANTSNIERILSELHAEEKGVYLPPRNLSNSQSSLIFIPKINQTPPPQIDQTEKLLIKRQDGIVLTPPGLPLSLLIEKELNRSLLRMDFEQLQNELPKVMIEKIELMDDITILKQDNTVTMQVTKSVLNDVCLSADHSPKVHSQVGCLLSSALACVLAKVEGKPITIQAETQTPKTKITTITYRIGEK
jgi:hypothetical protein